jgi:hypothetical protein
MIMSKLSTLPLGYASALTIIISTLMDEGEEGTGNRETWGDFECSVSKPPISPVEENNHYCASPVGSFQLEKTASRDIVWVEKGVVLMRKLYRRARTKPASQRNAKAEGGRGS